MSPEHLELKLNRATSWRARPMFDSWARGHGVRAPDRERLALVVSELVANAAQATHEPFAVAAARGSGALHLAVANRGSPLDIPDRAHWAPTDPVSPRGRGLSIVDAVADEVEVRGPSADTVAIVATLSLPD